MATQIQTETTTRTGDQHPTTDTANDTDDGRSTVRRSDSPPTDSWTSRCRAPATFDPASYASIGQFDTTADQH